MKHIKIVATCKATGDSVLAIQECHRLSKYLDCDIDFNFAEGISITVSPNSDLMEMIDTLHKMKKS